jgi:hypothetical protein
MTSRSSKNRNAIEILLLAVVMLLGYAFFIKVTGWRAEHSESNLQSNLIRISRYLHAPKVERVILGSSISGRLLEDYFNDEGVSISNLGLDGSRPLYGFEVLRKRQDLPQRLLVEVNLLFQPRGANDTALDEAVESPTFRLGAMLPSVKAENRPSSLLYTLLKGRQDAAGATSEATLSAQGDDGEVPLPPTYEEVSSQLNRLRNEGVKVTLLLIPTGKLDRYSREGKRLAKELGLPMLTLREMLPDNGKSLRYSDGKHLTADSAREVVRALADVLKQDRSNEPGSPRL